MPAKKDYFQVFSKIKREKRFQSNQIVLIFLLFLSLQLLTTGSVWKVLFSLQFSLPAFLFYFMLVIITERKILPRISLFDKPTLKEFTQLSYFVAIFTLFFLIINAALSVFSFHAALLPISASISHLIINYTLKNDHHIAFLLDSAWFSAVIWLLNFIQ